VDAGWEVGTVGHPFEFAVSAPTDVASGAEWLDGLRRIESLGFATVVMPDHFTDGYDLEPMVALSAAAAATSTLRLQTGVLGNDYRHPVLTARMAASLDLISDGRFVLGLGAGWMTSDYEAAGIPLDRAGVRVSRLDEAVQVVTGLLAGGRFRFSGEYYDVDLELLPHTVQRPLPLFIGGGSPRVLGIGGRHAHTVGVLARLRAGALGRHAIVDQTAERVAEKVGWVRDAAASVGRDPDSVRIEMNHWLVRVTDTAAEADAFLARVAARNDVTPELLAESPAVLVGTLGQIIEVLQARRERFGISCIQLDAGFAPKDIESLAPLVAALAET
jgi:probable F420-dependent oxidoreductase